MSATIVMCTFYFSANTLTMLFFDILKPLRMDKETLLRENQVTDREIEIAEGKAIIHRIMEIDVQRIKDSKELSEEEKKEQIGECFRKWKEIASNLAQYQENDDSTSTSTHCE